MTYVQEFLRYSSLQYMGGILTQLYFALLGWKEVEIFVSCLDGLFLSRSRASLTIISTFAQRENYCFVSIKLHHCQFWDQKQDKEFMVARRWAVRVPMAVPIGSDLYNTGLS